VPRGSALYSAGAGAVKESGLSSVAAWNRESDSTAGFITVDDYTELVYQVAMLSTTRIRDRFASLAGDGGRAEERVLRGTASRKSAAGPRGPLLSSNFPAAGNFAGNLKKFGMRASSPAQCMHGVGKPGRAPRVGRRLDCTWQISLVQGISQGTKKIGRVLRALFSWDRSRPPPPFSPSMRARRPRSRGSCTEKFPASGNF
jgi:hypothetical protein